MLNSIAFFRPASAKGVLLPFALFCFFFPSVAVHCTVLLISILINAKTNAQGVNRT